MERRSYRQFCGLARALDVVGERWTLLIVRNLLLGPKRYGVLLEELPGITTNLLAKRLRELEAADLIERAELGSGPAYRLTQTGAQLEPAVMELARWGGRFMGQPKREDTLNLGWGMLSLKRRYRGGESLTAEVRAQDRVFELVFTPDYLSVQERHAARPQVTLEGGPDAIRALFFGGVAPSQLIAAGQLRVDGAADAWATFQRALGLEAQPTPAPGAAGVTAPTPQSSVEVPHASGKGRSRKGPARRGRRLKGAR